MKFPMPLFEQEGGGSAPAPSAPVSAPAAPPSSSGVDPAAKPAAGADDGGAAPKAEVPKAREEEAPKLSLDEQLAKVWDDAHKEGPERDERGRFIPRNPPQEGDGGDDGDLPGNEPAGHDLGADEGPPDDDEGGTGEPPGIDPKAIATMPKSWAKEHAETWAALPPEAQEIISKRELDFQSALSRAGHDAARFKEFKPVFEAVTPFKDYLVQVAKHTGMTPANLIHQTLRFENLLRTADNPTKLNVLKDIVAEYQIDVSELFGGDVASAMSQGAAADPRVDGIMQTLQKVVGRLQSEDQVRQQAQDAELAREVQKYATDKVNYPYFEQARPKMAAILDAEIVDNIPDAYRLAIESIPELKTLTEAEKRRRAQKEREEANSRKANEARRASSVNVKSGMPSPSRKTSDQVLEEIGSKYYGR